MNTSSSQPPLPNTASTAPRTGTGATILVGVIAVAALALGIYVWTSRDPGESSRQIHELDIKLGELEKRLDRVAAASSNTKQTTAQGTETPPATASVPPPTISPPGQGTAAASSPVASGGYDIVANGELKGRLGRIVVAYPGGSKTSGARTDLFKAGDATKIRTDYGDFTYEVLPGAYDVVVGGRKVAGVAVQSRCDTRVRVGTLRLHATTNARFDLFAAGAEEKLQTLYGENDVGLPVGEFDVMVNNQRERVAISAGQITEY